MTTETRIRYLWRVQYALKDSVCSAVRPVVVISHDLWTAGFGAADDIVGRDVRINGSPVQIIGILQPGFAGHQTGILLDVFLPLGLEIPGLPSASNLDNPQSGVVEVLARLAPDVARRAAADQVGVAHGLWQVRAPPKPASGAGLMLMAMSRNSLSKKGTRASTPQAAMALFARRQS